MPLISCLLLVFLCSAFSFSAEIPLAYELPRDGNVSLAIYDSQGCMIRTFLHAEPQRAGKQNITWDGLDMDGKPAAAGQYEWRLLQTAGLRSEYLMSVGTSVGAQWYPGNHDGPACLAVEKGSFITAAATEGPPEISRCTFDGKILWERGSFEPARNPRDVAVGGGRVFYLQDSGKIQVLDAETGQSIGKPVLALFPVRKLTFPELKGDSSERQEFNFDLPNGEYLLRFHYGEKEHETTLVEVSPNGMEPSAGHRTLPDKMKWWQLPASAAGAAKPIFLPQIYGNPRAVKVLDGKLRLAFIPQAEKGKSVHWNVSEVEVLALPDRVAASPDQLVLSCTGAGAVMWIDAQTGAVSDSVPLAGVRDIAVAGNGRLYALTADSVVSLSREAKTPETRVRGLSDAALFAVDAQETIFVYERSSQQIKRFDKSGTLTGTFGRENGRLAGAYQPRDFAGVSGLAADGSGGFVISEQSSAPRRVARFDKDGAPVREWFGGMGFYAHTSLDPLDASTGWLRPQEKSWIIKVRLDYKTRDWKPVACYRWDEQLDASFFGRNPEYTHIRCMRRDLNGDGVPETLIWCQAYPALILVEDEANRKLRPLAAMGLVDADLFDTKKPLPVEKLPPFWAEAIRKAGADPADPKTRVKFARYTWADANGDGSMQADELQLAPGPVKDLRCLRVDSELAVWQGGFHAGQNGIYVRYKPVRYTACGAPVWDLAGAEAGFKTAGDAETVSITRNAGGETYVLLRGGGDGTKAQGMYSDVETHGWAWPAILSDASALLKLDANGKVIWRSANKAARWPHPRGQLMSPRNINGFVKGCVAVGDQVEQPCEFWMEDGLYVGGLFDGRNGKDGSLPGGEPDALYTWLGVKAKRIGQNNFREHSLFAGDDMLMGGAVAELPDGSVVFLGQGGNNNPCYRITGWDGWHRASGKVSVAVPVSGASRKGSGLKAEYFETLDFAGQPEVRTDAQLWFSPQKKKPWPRETAAKEFSVRWTGLLEPVFSEHYTLGVYARGEFKLWLDGKEVQWAPQDYPNEKLIRKFHSVPLPLRAGGKTAIKIEFKATQPNPAFHLNWESLSQPVEHIPTIALFPE